MPRRTRPSLLRTVAQLRSRRLGHESADRPVSHACVSGLDGADTLEASGADSRA